MRWRQRHPVAVIIVDAAFLFSFLLFHFPIEICARLSFLEINALELKL